MRLPKPFLTCLFAAVAMVSTGSAAHAAAMLQSLVTSGINTLTDKDFEVYIPVTPGGNPGGKFMAGDTIITYTLFTQFQNGNGQTFGIGSTNYGSPTGGSTVFGNFYQYTSVTVTTLGMPIDITGTSPNQLADIPATSVTTDYENAAYTPTNNSSILSYSGTEFNPNRLNDPILGTPETDAQLRARLNTEATSGNVVITGASNQFWTMDGNLTLTSIPSTGFGVASTFGFKETSNPGGLGFVPNGITTTAQDPDFGTTGGVSQVGPTPTDFAGTTFSTLNVSHGPTQTATALPILTATTLQFAGVATPEPSSMLIWGGLALAGGVYQRRRRASSSRAAS